MEKFFGVQGFFRGAGSAGSDTKKKIEKNNPVRCGAVRFVNGAVR